MDVGNPAAVKAKLLLANEIARYPSYNRINRFDHRGWAHVERRHRAKVSADGHYWTNSGCCIYDMFKFKFTRVPLELLVLGLLLLPRHEAPLTQPHQ